MNIRTVASLGKEEYFINKFQSLIHAPYRLVRDVYLIVRSFSRCAALHCAWKFKIDSRKASKTVLVKRARRLCKCHSNSN